MAGSLKPLNREAFTFRYHPEGTYGDPYDFVCTVEIEGEEAFISAALGHYRLAVHREIRRLLIERGVTRVDYGRVQIDRPVGAKTRMKSATR